MKPQTLPGFRDSYPTGHALRSHILDTWRTVARRDVYEEYDGPPLEPLALYTEKSGDEIVAQLYAFKDKGDRDVALRPEMTPTLARMVAAKAGELRKPIRWFSIPQLFRYERQQRGRLREHFQLNCDLIGEAGPLADAEIVALSIDVMRAFGLTEKDVRVRISDRRVYSAVLRASGIPEEGIPAALAVIDKAGRLDEKELFDKLVATGRSKAEAAAALDAAKICGRADIEAALAKVPEGAAIGASLLSTLSALDAMGLGGFVDVDFSIVRGLAYYTGTVFELFDAGRTLRAICGGGRYDNLTGAVGGVELPAVGFGMGDVVLGELLKEKGKLPAYTGSIDAFVAVEGQDGMAAALKLTHQLRDAGVRAEYAIGGQTISKQQDIAKARNARLLVTIGASDVQVKDLQAKTTQAVALQNAVDSIR